MREFNDKLVKLGWVYRNQANRWACPALPVRKPGTEDFRQTSDYNPLNAVTEPIAGVMPNLIAKLQHARHKRHYGLFDFIKGFWQLPLAESSQEMLSYATDEGVFTPTRVPQGSCDAALHFPATMEKCFAELVYKSLLIWIDDLLLFADTIEEYLAALETLFDTMAHYGLKFSVMKTCLYQQSVTWCGKIISENGMTHDPRRIDALLNMPPPSTAGELQQFICASNWMRDSLIDYARTIQPLQQCLDRGLEGKRKTKRVAAGIALQLNESELVSFDNVKKLLANSSTLAHPKDNATFALFCDASDVGWSAILTQVESWDDAKPVTEQNHELLTCKGGTFTGTQLPWSVTEKEAFPIVSACDDLNYLLLRPGGFKIFCDHRNLIYMFAPHPETKKHIRGKLLRWSLKLTEYRYTIAHIEDEQNVWADLVSRWGGASPTSVMRFKRVTRMQTQAEKRPLLRPLDKDSFVWPTLSEIAVTQKAHLQDRPESCTQGDDGVYRSDGKIWVPEGASGLIQRLFIVSHCGPQGHRGEAVMLNHIKRIFKFKEMAQRARRFLKSCLLCHHVKG
ncbi:hypothetical protein PR003_g14240 [Phytophthora rubi]|uniref:Reverse transcriptase domain-containing protein n=1 Tax=Phytophthora rubi TaxID=129364 RepID=A0A6A4F4L9_9STRA|nr:hypothetical protein PR003_g14240 [Phytophthora rubi]